MTTTPNNASGPPDNLHAAPGNVNRPHQVSIVEILSARWREEKARRQARTMQGIQWLVIAMLVGTLALLVARDAQADMISEFGAGMKNPRTTSVILLPECHHVVIDQTRPDTPHLNFRGASCGGDNPVFIGWPIAWERELEGQGIWTVRLGWFHMSHWNDGGAERETHFDCICASIKVNWGAVTRRNR